MKLSARLEALLARCQPGLPLWDLCCDHGYLGLAALASGRFPQVIFNDAVPHLIENLRPRVPRASIGARILCAPAEAIDEPLTGNVVIAGVGGEKIYKILLAHAAERLQARNIIVCPEKDAQWLAGQTIPGYALTDRVSIAHGSGVRWIFHYKSSQA